MRIKCPRCLRPENYCYCQGLQPEQAATDILILQHPTESRHPLNTARIAELGLSNSQITVGETFTDLDSMVEGKTTCLLFPTDDAIPLPQYLEENPVPEQCMVIDGTWRKARKIIYCNPLLNTLPAVTLEPGYPSQYRIRKAPSSQSLATIEAIVTFLRVINRDNRLHQRLLDAFNKLIEQQINTMGEAVYKKNYAHH